MTKKLGEYLTGVTKGAKEVGDKIYQKTFVEHPFLTGIVVYRIPALAFCALGGYFLGSSHQEADLARDVHSDLNLLGFIRHDIDQIEDYLEIIQGHSLRFFLGENAKAIGISPDAVNNLLAPYATGGDPDSAVRFFAGGISRDIDKMSDPAIHESLSTSWTLLEQTIENYLDLPQHNLTPDVQNYVPPIAELDIFDVKISHLEEHLETVYTQQVLKTSSDGLTGVFALIVGGILSLKDLKKTKK